MDGPFLTHNNGGRPFAVTFQNNRVYIQDNYENELLLTLPIDEYIVGQSPLTPQTEFSGGHGPEFLGNSILAKLSHSRGWLFIGDRILVFEPLSELVEFVSPVGNSDVPYPYAVDKDGRVYLLIENAILAKGVPPEYKSIPYDYYYKANLIISDKGFVPEQKPEFPFRNIESFSVNGENITLRWQADIDSAFSRVWGTLSTKLALKYHDDPRFFAISETNLIQLNDEFAQLKGFLPLKPILLFSRA